MNTAVAGFGWLTIIRLGLVQSALGSIVVLTTSTLNRVMVVELALPAVLPGALVGLHYAVQIARPRFGYGSDNAGRRTPWIVGGMAALCLGATTAAAATALMASRPAAGLVAAILAFVVIGAGVGASGTSLLALLAKRVAPARRAAAAAVVWLMMIFGIIVTAGVGGALLEPFSIARLVAVAAGVAGTAFVVTLAAIWDVEGRDDAQPIESVDDARPRPSFSQALRTAWADRQARRFTVFVFVSMLAYSMQDLILEPFAGLVFGLSPGESTQLTGVQHSGVLLGMLGVGALASGLVLPRIGTLRQWAIAGCAASALALLCLTMAAFAGPPWPLKSAVFALGAANGGFAVSAIALMMGLAGAGGDNSEGTRVGLWGAAQAIAFGLGGFAGTLGVDTAQYLFGSPVPAYGFVFALQALLFLVSAVLMLGIGSVTARGAAPVVASD